MSSSQTPIEEHFKNLMKYLYAISPAVNLITQFLFMLENEKVINLIKMYPELMEKEDALFYLFEISYSPDGRLRTNLHGGALGFRINTLYRGLFESLSDPIKRSILLSFANMNENEFKDLDPLRAWIEVSLDYLARINKNALILLDIIIDYIISKYPDTIRYRELYISDSEIIEVARNRGINNPEQLLYLLRRFYLILRAEHGMYLKECPLLLPVYSDLRSKIKEIIKQN